MLESQKRLIRDGVTDGGSRIELIGWTITLDDGERRNVREIHVDDRYIASVSTSLDADPNCWMSQNLYSTFSLMF